MNDCERIRQLLAEEDPPLADRDARLREHLIGCPRCRGLLESLRRLEASLGGLPAHDAPESLLRRTVAAIAAEQEPARSPQRERNPERRWASALAAAVVFLSILGLTQHLSPILTLPFSTSADLLEAQPKIASIGQRAKQDAFELPENAAFSRESFRAALPEPRAPSPPPAAPASSPAEPEEEIRSFEDQGDRLWGDDAARASRNQSSQIATGKPVARGPGDRYFGSVGANTGAGDEEGAETPSRRDNQGFEGNMRGQAADVKNLEALPRVQHAGGYETAQLDARLETKGEDLRRKLRSPAPPRAEPDDRSSRPETGIALPHTEDLDEMDNPFMESQERTGGIGGMLASLEKREKKPATDAPPSALLTEGRAFFDGEGTKAKAPTGQSPLSAHKIASPDSAQLTARRFLAENASVKDLAFQEPTGYWANTYIPGDPRVRLLESRLNDWDRSTLGTDVRLERAARQIWQPLDDPGNAALALYLHADRAGVDGPARMRVQVGLKATRRQSGHRPAMNLGLVLDLRSRDHSAIESRVRALVAALRQAHQPGDRFSITLAGRPGGQLVAPGAFRHGPIKLALDGLFDESSPDSPPALNLLQAVQLARQTVQTGDDPTATLGASLILLATDSDLGSDLPALERLAHHCAVGGTPLSVVALGNGAHLDEIDRLVRLGQGNRRILGAPGEAPALIDRELHAVGRVVARAVRLRIRLAPGVKLVDVLGSHRLDASQARRVRAAEQSIDQRLARNLGIQTDRGEDEEGIQILIPAFQSGDVHVILLDVVAQRPGPVADATVRYKDLVHLRNGVARTRLDIAADERAAGPLQLNVMKNRLAFEVARAARLAGQQLAAGDSTGARAILTDIRDLLRGMRREVPGWSSDAELLDDEAMLAQYLKVLALPMAEDPRHQDRLADSLRHAAQRKLQGKIAE